MSVSFAPRDAFPAPNLSEPLSAHLVHLHQFLRDQGQPLHRISIALYEEETDLLKTFVHSSEGGSALVHYQARLAESRSLSEMARSGLPRLVTEPRLYAGVAREHARRIGAEGYTASYTVPMGQTPLLLGFVFFNSRDPAGFSNGQLATLDLAGQLLSLAVRQELANFRTLTAAVRTICDLSLARDQETGNHLARMSRYARLIGRGVAGHYGCDDEFVEHLQLFAPLHDIGKIGIPDRILLKPAALTAEERRVMRTHAVRGREMVDLMLGNFAFEGWHCIGMARNVVEYHHEAVNGSGYPHGLRGEAIPLEARIISVADVFDALTSVRPYKPAWSNDQAFDYLQEEAGRTLDPACVAALVAQRAEAEGIQARFREDPHG